MQHLHVYIGFKWKNPNMIVPSLLVFLNLNAIYMNCNIANFKVNKQKIQCPSFYKYNCTGVTYDTIGHKLACQKLLMIVL